MSDKSVSSHEPVFSGWTIGTVFGVGSASPEGAGEAEPAAGHSRGWLLYRLLRRCLGRDGQAGGNHSGRG